MSVWVIEDEKYGLQLICETKELAIAELASGKWSISGSGADIYEWDVKKRPTTKRVRDLLKKYRKNPKSVYKEERGGL